MEDAAIRQKVFDFLLDMSHWFTSKDRGSPAVHYASPVVLIKANETTIFHDTEAFQAYPNEGYKRVMAIGGRTLLPEIERLQLFTPGITMVDVKWHILGENGREIGFYWVTYGLREEPDGYRIAVHISHNATEVISQLLEDPDAGKKPEHLAESRPIPL